MSLRFLIDAQLPPALANRLSAEGYGAEHVVRLGYGAASDIEIWTLATERKSVLITKDEDFLALARSDPAGPQVVWIRIGNTTNVALWRVFEPCLPELISALSAGERIVEIV